MPRIPRFITPGCVHHVISRFVDREWFFANESERNYYLFLFGRALEKTDWACLAYCLMSNHIHLAMLAGRDDLESWAKRVNSPFAIWLNEQHDRLGPVFAERPDAYRVPSEREADVIAYIHNNPVRAKVAGNARSSSWSSHQAYLGLTPAPAWLRVDEGLARSGCAGAPERFDRLVNSLADRRLEFPELDQARRDARRFGAVEIGTPTLSSPAELPIVSRPYVRARVTMPALLAAVAKASGVAVDAMDRRHARGDIAAVKRVVIHAATRLRIPLSEASAAINVSRQRGSKVAQMTLSTAEQEVVMRVVRSLR
jgi:REP element-mobilizing transposase RayT